MLITDLPAETIDQIAAAIDSPSDLRNLAAVCTQLRLVLEPNHTQFRVIHAPLVSPIWKKIAENRLFAKNIRVLEIQDAGINGNRGDPRLDKPIIPAIFRELEVPWVPIPDNSVEEVDADAIGHYGVAKNNRDLDAERSLVSALKGMSGLTSFRWTRNPPFINRDQEDDIWITLAKYCTSLNTIDVLDNEQHWPQEIDHPVYQCPSLNPNFYLFQDLKSFSLYTDAFNVGNPVPPDVERCAEMLVRRCPNLEVLKLDYVLYANPHASVVPASPLISGPSWTSLRELVLSGFDFISAELASCLASHPTIETLSLRSSEINPSLVLPPGTLPRLQRLSTDLRATLISSVLDCAISTPRPLKYIEGLSLNDAFLTSLEHSGSGPSLQKLFLECSDDLNYLITRLSDIAPNLECLDIYRNASFQTFYDSDLYTVFGRFPRLRMLRGLKFLVSNCKPASVNTEIVRALATACPNLQIVSWYSPKLDLGVSIKRDGSRVAWTLHSMMPNGMDLGDLYPSWGERGCGSFQL